MLNRTHHGTARLAGLGRRASLVAGIALILSGCGNMGPHHIQVGAIPDDYRTRHPIIISEREQTFDIPVASGDRGLTQSMRESVRGATDRYHAVSTGSVRILTPVGSPNSGAASIVAGKMVEIFKQEGIPAERIIISGYQAAASGDAAPIRIAFTATTAATGECGRWPEDILAGGDQNRNYENFGCATQSNLAAQIANPADLLGPRGSAHIDAERRSILIENYRKNGAELGG